MAKFKLGDTVRIIGNTKRGCNSIGDIGIITEINDCSISFRIQVKGKSATENWYISKDIEVIPKEEYSEYISPLNSYYYL